MKIVLTAPATEMSDHNKRIFLGFGTCFPPVIIPPWFLRLFFYPKVRTKKNGIAKYAPYGLRKIEAILVNDGFEEFDVAVVPPDKLERFVGPETRVIGISTMDPLGYGPVSITFSAILGGKATTKIEFYKLMKMVRDLKSKYKHLKIIVGGSGAWQLELNKEIQKRLGIDTIVTGEGDAEVYPLFQKAIKGDFLPKKISMSSPSPDRIIPIRNASIDGLIEVSRGCGRHCQFCSAAARKRQDIPLEIIVEEIKVNIREKSGDPILHAEDVLMWGSKDNFRPEREAVKRLFKTALAVPRAGSVGVSHISLAAPAADPQLISELSEIMKLGKGHLRFFAAQTGIETGSPKLIKQLMKAKPLPFRPEEWPEVVRQAFGVLNDNHWVPAATIVIGLPKETPEDVQRTLELLDDLKDNLSLMVPLFFIPMKGAILEKAKAFIARELEYAHWELFVKCLDHDAKHIFNLEKEYLRGLSLLNFVVGMGFKIFSRWIRLRAQKLDFHQVYKKLKVNLEKAGTPKPMVANVSN
ncbi:MAG: B12-binding domain-containing radical SAM protein [Candidatus Hodarchaeota archaeon]